MRGSARASQGRLNQQETEIINKLYEMWDENKQFLGYDWENADEIDDAIAAGKARVCDAEADVAGSVICYAATFYRFEDVVSTIYYLLLDSRADDIDQKERQRQLHFLGSRLINGIVRHADTATLALKIIHERLQDYLSEHVKAVVNEE